MNSRRGIAVAVVVVLGAAAAYAYHHRPMRYHPDGSPCVWGDPWVTRTKMVDADGNKTGRGYACHGCTQEWSVEEDAA